MTTEKVDVNPEQLLKNLTALSDSIHIYAGTVAIKAQNAHDDEINRYMGMICTRTNQMLTEVLVYLNLSPRPNNRQQLVRTLQAKLKKAGKEMSEAEIVARLNDQYFAGFFSAPNPPDISGDAIEAIVEHWL